MKNIILILAVIFGLCAFQDGGKKKNLAEVNQIEGYFIFTDSKPVNEFEYLGTVKPSHKRISNPQYTNVRDAMIQDAKSQYPRADALILTLNAGGVDLVEAIRFK